MADTDLGFPDPMALSGASMMPADEARRRQAQPTFANIPAKGTIAGILSAEGSNGAGLWRPTPHVDVDDMGRPIARPDIWSPKDNPRMGLEALPDVNVGSPFAPQDKGPSGDVGKLGDSLARPDNESPFARGLREPAQPARSDSAPPAGYDRGPTGNIGPQRLYDYAAGGQPGQGASPTPPALQPATKSTSLSSMLGIPPDSLLDRLFTNLGNFRDANKLTLLALAGGLAGSQSWGQGLGRGFSAAVPAQMADIQQGRFNATVNHFKANGMDHNAAVAFAGNPALTQAALGQQYGIIPPHTMNVPGLMGSTSYQWNPQLTNPQTGKPGMWQPLQVAGGGSGAGSPSPAASPGGRMDLGGGMYANATPEQWSAMSPDKREESLDPASRGLVHLMRTGATVPSPRQWAAGVSLMGQVDPSWTPDMYNAQKTMASDLEKNTPGSNGGNLLKGLSTFGHVADWGQAAADVGGWSGPNMPGGGVIGEAYTAGRTAAASPDLQSKLATERKTALRAGQESTSFYSQAGGGEGERTANVMDSTGHLATPAKKAGALRGEAQLMQTKIEMLMQKVLSNPAGKEFFNRNQELIKGYQTNLAKIHHAIAQLDPNGPEAAEENGRKEVQAAPAAQRPPAASGQTQTGVRWSVTP